MFNGISFIKFTWVFLLAMAGLSCQPGTPPSAAFSSDVRIGIAPLAVSFFDDSVSGSSVITAWLWNFGDGVNSALPNPQHVYNSPGGYSVSLTVTSKDGDSTTTIQNYIVVSDDIIMAPVPAGGFEMGDSFDEGPAGELPLHTVSLSDYFIGKYEVTNKEFVEALNWAYDQGLLKEVGGEAYNGGATIWGYDKPLANIQEDDTQIEFNVETFSVRSRTGSGKALFSMEMHPVVDVSWYGAAAYCNWRSAMEVYSIPVVIPVYNTTDWSANFDANGYRLPTEAEWERAAAWDGAHRRYGTSSDGISCATANFTDGVSCNPLGLDAIPYTNPVGHYAGTSSPVGCFDMSGNVREWCYDGFSVGYYSVSPSSNPTGQSGSALRVLRGGGWGGLPYHCRSAGRSSDDPVTTNFDIGFRVARTQ